MPQFCQTWGFCCKTSVSDT